MENLSYDVAISFADEDRAHAENLAEMLQIANVRVFYDRHEESRLWGEDLPAHLGEVYSTKARYCVMIISRHYAEKNWTRHERRFAQARALQDESAYILPVRLDDTEVPGLPSTVGHVDLRRTTMDHVVRLILEKLAETPDRPRTTGKSLTGLQAYAAATIAAHRKPARGPYIPLRAASASRTEPVPADELADALIADKGSNFLAVLGGYGTGKTTLCKHLRLKYCQKIVDDSGFSVVPVYVDLRRSAHLLRSPDPLAAILAACRPPVPDSGSATYLLLLDGFDEILHDRHETNIGTLLENEFSGRQVKIILTSRTHFFRTELDAATRMAAASTTSTGLVDLEETVRAVQRNAVELMPFKPEDVKTYLEGVFPENSAEYYEKLLRIYDLDDLARRPILLELIVSVLPRLDESEVFTEADVYETAVRLWFDREIWRGIDPARLLEFMKALSVQMFYLNRLELNIDELTGHIQREFAQYILSRIDLDRFDEIIRTSGFISRDAAGNFSFMHRSIMEYFFAKSMEDRIRRGELGLMRRDGVAPVSPWLFDRDENERESMLDDARGILGIEFGKYLFLSDGIIELLAGSLKHRYPDNPVTVDVAKFVAARSSFREKERRLERIANAIRSGEPEPAPVPDQDDLPEITMIGGGGRIYYNTEVYEFSLLVGDGDDPDRWTFLLNKSVSWRHT
ncbi:TIR domain-containing protein [Amycolatopsis eburnea]|uniref:TIR domain-containing protein n=1 Tax=Amycolatopsis eburnea TaxID=2267691 RepID=A0A3R9KNN0_9PSEU|nr:TIR domain-containing protein [Amycolatopsis eburnea]RSD20895.1 TIR domain-containing protein [Amycolatopsis eburnea]